MVYLIDFFTKWILLPCLKLIIKLNLAGELNGVLLLAGLVKD